MYRIKRLTAVLLAVFLLAGCGKSAAPEAPGDQMSVIAILKARNSLHWHFVMEGLNQAAKKNNINLNVLWPESETDIDTQIRMLEDAILTAPDAIIWAPDDSAHADEYAKKIRDAGIELLYVDENAEVQSDVPYIGSDNYHAGELAAEKIQELVPEGGIVAFIGGAQDQQVHRLRAQGFRKTLESSPVRYTILPAAEVPDCSIRGGKKVMESFLQYYPEIKGVFCASALLCMGAQEACQSKGRKDIFFVGMDTQSDVLTALKTGKIQSIISQSGYEMGYTAIDLLVKKQKGEKIPLLNYIDNEIISKENVEEYLDIFINEGRE